ncbi:uncharacterized protein LOC132197356 [Neocloeon triangulifer]|uniref:uncharacterized protein LOC132197356 n=1 Tax=Neocloeon triangulifer TaxID=2078957 RepID=UPI00286EFF5F|nr:uncharacterized protein LOC132197356 [Neocloeon triangulifer]
MAAKVFTIFALCVTLAVAKPQYFAAAPAVVAAAPVTTVSHSAALSAHPVPGTNLISGYSHQAVHKISRSAALLAVPAASYVSSPYVAAAHPFSPYVSAPYVSAPYVSAPAYYV